MHTLRNHLGNIHLLQPPKGLINLNYKKIIIILFTLQLFMQLVCYFDYCKSVYTCCRSVIRFIPHLQLFIGSITYILTVSDLKMLLPDFCFWCRCEGRLIMLLEDRWTDRAIGYEFKYKNASLCNNLFFSSSYSDTSLTSKFCHEHRYM